MNPAESERKNVAVKAVYTTRLGVIRSFESTVAANSYRKNLNKEQINNKITHNFI